MRARSIRTFLPLSLRRPLLGQLLRGLTAPLRGGALPLFRGTVSQIRWLVRLWPSKTQVLVIIATFLVILMVIGILGVVYIHGFEPETAALLVAWATIVGVMITQIITAKLAADRAEDDTLQAYLEKMDELLTDKGLRKPLEQKNDEVRASAQAHTLVILKRLGARSRRVPLHFLHQSALINRDNTAANNRSKKMIAIPPENPVISLRGAHLRRSYLQGEYLRGADLSEVYLFLAKLSGADLSYSDLSGAVLSGADLSDAVLNEAVLSGADLGLSRLRRANLSNANLSGAKLGASRLRRVNLSNADLSGAKLEHSGLPRANLSGAHPRNADLSVVDLSNTNLSGADLSGANLKVSDLYGAALSNADLSGADLRGSDLCRAELSNANLSGADLRRAYLMETKNVTPEQVKQAYGDRTTKLPEGLEYPDRWNTDD